MKPDMNSEVSRSDHHPQIVKTASTGRVIIAGQRLSVLGEPFDSGVFLRLAQSLVHFGLQIEIVLARHPQGKSRLEESGFVIHFLNCTSSEFPRRLSEKIRELSSQIKTDLIHCVDYSTLPLARNKRREKFKVLFDVSATDISSLFSIIGMKRDTLASVLTTGTALAYRFLSSYFGKDREILKLADGIFVHTPEQGLFLERYYGYPQLKIHYVPYSLEAVNLNPLPRAKELYAKYRLPETSHLILTFTDMNEPQEMFNILTAFEFLVVKKPQTFLVVMGHGPHFKEIERFALDLALGSKVLFVGAVSQEELWRWLSVCEVYLDLSSRSTGFDPIILNAMAQKKVFIGSELSPIAHIVEDGLDGFLIRPADTQSLSYLLLEIFSGTLPIAEIGQKARDRIENIFDLEKMSSKLHEAYLKLLS
jgi:glycosyltransferase involved in cell wall biosynthesis